MNIVNNIKGLKTLGLLLVTYLFFNHIAKAERSLNANTTNINILMPAPFADSTSGLVKEFNTTNKGNIRINVTRGPLETEAVSDLAISTLLLGENQYDILLVDITWLAKYAAADWLEPLDKYIPVGDWKRLAHGARLGNDYNNKIYRWPLVSDMGLLYWRKDLMDSPPKTPEELLTIASKLKKDGKVKYGYVWQGRQYEGLSCVFVEVLAGFGGSWLDKSLNPNLDSDQSIEAANWMLSLIESGASPKSVTNFAETEVLQVFEAGDAAFMRNWPYAWSELHKSDSQIKGKVGVTSMVSILPGNQASTLGSWGFSILKLSRNTKEAYQVIRFLTSEKAQRELFLKNGYTPTSRNLFKDQLLQQHSEILPYLEKALSITKGRPQTPLYAQISNVLQTELSSLLTKQKSTIEAMKSANKKTIDILSSAGKKK